MMNRINETKDHFEPDKYLEIEAEKVLGAIGYVNDGAGKWIRPEGKDQAQNCGDWYRNE
jgi:hypothetical protein